METNLNVHKRTRGRSNSDTRTEDSDISEGRGAQEDPGLLPRPERTQRCGGLKSRLHARRMKRHRSNSHGGTKSFDSELLSQYGIQKCSVLLRPLEAEECRAVETDLPEVGRTRTRSVSHSVTKKSDSELLKEHGFKSCSVVVSARCPVKEFSVYHGTPFFREIAEDVQSCAREGVEFDYREFYRQTRWSQCSCLSREACERKVRSHLRSRQSFDEFMSLRLDLIGEKRRKQRRKMHYSENEFAIVRGDPRQMREALMNGKSVRVRLGRDAETRRLVSEALSRWTPPERREGAEGGPAEEPEAMHAEPGEEDPPVPGAEEMQEQSNPLEDAEPEVQPDDSGSETVSDDDHIGSPCGDHPEMERDSSSGADDEERPVRPETPQTDSLESCAQSAMASCSPKVLLRRLDSGPPCHGRDCDRTEHRTSFESPLSGTELSADTDIAEDEESKQYPPTTDYRVDSAPSPQRRPSDSDSERTELSDLYEDNCDSDRTEPGGSRVVLGPRTPEGESPPTDENTQGSMDLYEEDGGYGLRNGSLQDDYVVIDEVFNGDEDEDSAVKSDCSSGSGRSGRGARVNNGNTESGDEQEEGRHSSSVIKGSIRDGGVARHEAAREVHL